MLLFFVSITWKVGLILILFEKISFFSAVPKLNEYDVELSKFGENLFCNTNDASLVINDWLTDCTVVINDDSWNVELKVFNVDAAKVWMVD